MNRPRLLADLDRTAHWLASQGLAEPEHRVSTLPTPELVVDGRPVISFSTNNYLGLNRHPEVMAAANAALTRYSYATSESRRLGGNLGILEELEAALAEHKQMPAALVTATGLLANIAAVHGVVDAVHLAHRWYGAPRRSAEAIVVYDELAHRSIRMGARLAGATRLAFRHNDVGHLAGIRASHRTKAALVVTEGVFSMDGDLADLPGLAAACEAAGATLMVDDAHGTGLYGPTGSGTVEHFGLVGRVPLQVATMSKALGGLGGVVVCDAATASMLRAFASGYRFTSSLPAEVAAGLLASLRIMEAQPQLRAKVWENTYRLRAGLDILGLPAAGHGPIVPLIAGSSATATQLETRLLARGYWCAAAAPPLVAPDACRLRLTVTAMHTEEHIDGLLNALEGLLTGAVRMGMGQLARAPGD
jgi:8-amino-7-oxononanoate synthase